MDDQNDTTTYKSNTLDSSVGMLVEHSTQNFSEIEARHPIWGITPCDDKCAGRVPAA